MSYLPNISWFSFYDKLQYKSIEINCATTMLMASLVTQNSISYLDLQISEEMLVFKRAKWGWEGFKYFANTEETLRKYLALERRILYTQHLHIPEVLHYFALRSSIPQKNFYCTLVSPHVVISVSDYYYSRMLSSFLIEAFRKKDKIKVLKCIVNLNIDKCLSLPSDLISYFINYLYKNYTDLNFIFNCFRKMGSLPMSLFIQHPDVIEYILYLSRKVNYDIKRESNIKSSLTDYSIFSSIYKIFGIALKYEDQCYFTEYSYNIYKSYVNYEWNKSFPSILAVMETYGNRTRFYRLLQTFYIFCMHDDPDLLPVYQDCPLGFGPEGASKILGLLWNSIPDPYLCFHEIKITFRYTCDSEMMNDLHSFYIESVGASSLYYEPRSLGHYCRTTIRKILYQNNQWIPEGIEQLRFNGRELPREIKSYLNLYLETSLVNLSLDSRRDDAVET